MSLDKLRDLYQKIYPAFCMRLDETTGGLYLYWSSGKTAINLPITITSEGKEYNLFHPQKNVLDSGGGDNGIIFHPGCESYLKGESSVLHVLQKFASWRLSITLGHILSQMSKLILNDEVHKEMPATLKDVLQAVPNPPKKLTWMCNQINDRFGEEFLGISFKRHDMLGNTEYRRVAYLVNPVFLDIDLKDHSIRDFKKDDHKSPGALESFVSLYNWVLPDHGVETKYGHGTDSETAPNFITLLTMFSKVAVRFNEILRDYSQYIADADRFMIPLDYVTDLSSLATLANALPAQRGNVGAAVQGENIASSEENSSVDDLNAPQTQRATPATTQPATRQTQHQTQAPAPVQQNGPRSAGDVIRERNAKRAEEEAQMRVVVAGAGRGPTVRSARTNGQYRGNDVRAQRGAGLARPRAGGVQRASRGARRF